MEGEEKTDSTGSPSAVISPREWAERNLNVREIELPSGAVFRVRNIDLPTMVSKGVLPLDLVQGFMQIAQSADRAELAKGHLGGLSEKDLAGLDSLCRKFVTAAVIAPPVSETEPTSDAAINVQDISFDDVMFIFSQCVKGGGRQFAEFFRPTGNAVHPGQDGAGIRTAPVRARRNKG